jgi:hypothetical protein
MLVVSIEVAPTECERGLRDLGSRIRVALQGRQTVVLVRNAPPQLDARIRRLCAGQLLAGHGNGMLTIAPVRCTRRAVDAPRLAHAEVHAVVADGTLVLHVANRAPRESDEAALQDLVGTLVSDGGFTQCALMRSQAPRHMGHGRPVWNRRYGATAVRAYDLGP